MSADYREGIRVQGLCTQCGKNKAVIKDGEQLLCSECARKQVGWSKERSKALSDSGICPHCGAKIEVGATMCEDCREKRRERRKESERRHRERNKVKRAENAESGTIVMEVGDKYYEGEEKYREASLEGGEFSEMGLDMKENIDRCLNCEIPAQYCTGENCVRAYRTWKYVEELKEKNGRKK